MFGFLSGASAILAAGLVTIIVIFACFLLRYLAPDRHVQKTRRRKFSNQPDHQSVLHSRKVHEASPFHVLGFTSVPSSFAEVRSAFLYESNKTHPDTNPDDVSAAKRFDMVKKAYEQIGTPDLFNSYIQRNPPDEFKLTTDGGEAKVFTIEEFAISFESLRLKWERAEANRTAEIERRLLGGRHPPNWTFRISKFLKRIHSRPKTVQIEDVIFEQSGESPKARYFKLYDCLIDVDGKDRFYQAIRLLLSHNGFKDTFSDVKGNSNCVTIIGDLPGPFIFPRPVKVLVSHDDQPEKLFTRLWDLGLYRGPKVIRLG